MSDQKPPRNYSAYQQKIIKRYYDNLDSIALQRLADLVGELYLAEGKKRERVWQNVAKTLDKLELPKARVEQIMKLQKPEMVAELVKELQAKG